MKLVAELRTETGTNSSRQLRKAGKVPATLYVKGADSTPLAVDAREFDALIKKVGKNTPFTLTVDGTDKEVVVTELDRAALKEEFYSIDFKEA